MSATTFATANFNAVSETLRRRLPARLREPGFWIIQALILATTLTHVLTEVTGLSESLGDWRHLPVILYVVPIVVAALRYGFEGALLSTLQCLIVAVPSVSFWHHSIWSLELVAIFAAAFISNLLSWRIDRESRLRKAAEELAARLSLAEADIRDYATALTETQETERHHLARELHDSSLQDVLLIVRNLEELDRTMNAEDRHGHEAVSGLIDLSRSVANDLRRYSESLRPPVLDDLGLLPAIESLADELTERTGIESNITLRGDLPDFKQEVSLAVFRIVQEALRNVEKHARAEKVEIAISRPSQSVEIIIHDDGAGFDPLSRHSGNSMGLRGMKERAVLVQGSLAIASAPGEGTSVRLTFPVRPKEVKYVG